MNINFKVDVSKQYIKRAITLGALFTSIFVLPAYADKKIAVLPFEIPNERQEIKQFSYGTMAVVNHTLNSMPEYTVIDRGQIVSILKEIGFQQTGYTDEKTSVKIGKMSGVDILVLGTIQAFNNSYRINLNVTDVQTGKIIKTFQVTGTDMFSLQDQLAKELLTLGTNKESIVKKSINPEAFSLFTQAKDAISYLDTKEIKKVINLLDKSITLEANYTDAINTKIQAKAILTFLLKEEGKPYNDNLLEVKKSINELSASEKQKTEIYLANYFIAKIENNILEEKKLSDKLIQLSKSEYIQIISSLGKFYTDSNKSKAISFINQAITLAPDNMYLLLDLGRVYSNNGEPQKALDLYEKVLKSKPNFIPALTNIAHVYSRQHKYEEAIKTFKKILELQPDSANTYYSMAMTYYMNDDNSNAIIYMKKSIELDNTVLYSFVTLGHIYSSEEKFAEANEVYNKAMELVNDPSGNYEHEKVYVYQNIGDFYKDQKKYQEALNIYNKALEIEPENSDIYSSIGDLYSQMQKYEESIYYYNKAISFVPANDTFNSKSNYYTSIGNVYLSQNKNNEALAAFIESIKLNPKNVSSIINITSIKKKEGKVDEAITYYLDGIKAKPDYPIFYANLIDLYMQKKNYSEAIKFIDMFKNIKNISKMNQKYVNEKLFDAYMNLGIYFHSTGKIDEATNFYSEAIKIKPDASIYNNLGVIYYTKAKYQEAIDQYKKALEIKPDYADSHNNLGIIYQVLGYKAEADNEYKKACDFGLKSSCK